MEAYLRSYVSFKQDDWVQYLPTAEFAYNNAKHLGTKFTPSELNCGFHSRASYEAELDPRSRSRAAGIEANALKELLTVYKNNLRDAQELEARYHHKSVKKRTYAPGETVWLASRNIKTKRNKKLEDKFFGPFEAIEPVGKQACCVPPPTAIPMAYTRCFPCVSSGKEHDKERGGGSCNIPEIPTTNFQQQAAPSRTPYFRAARRTSLLRGR